MRVHDSNVEGIDLSRSIRPLSLQGFIDVGSTGVDLSKGYDLFFSVNRDQPYYAARAIFKGSAYTWQLHRLIQTPEEREVWISFYSNGGEFYTTREPVSLGTDDVDGLMLDLDEMEKRE